MQNLLILIVVGLAVALGACATQLFGQPEIRDVKKDSRFLRRYDKDHPAEFAPRFVDRASWEQRRDFLRHQALVALGLWPMPQKTPLNAVVHGRIDRGDYTIENVFFASMPGHYVTGNLYRPKNDSGKHPAVLCPYGHWPEGRFIWNSDAKIEKELASGAEQTAEGARSPLQARCAMLARMGCVVFHYDLVGYADSHPIEHPLGFTDLDAALRAQSMLGLQTWNSIRAVDFVAGLPDVDSQRLAVTGASGGASQAVALSIVDPRIVAAFPVVMVSMNMQGGCVCENAPLYRVGTNNVELACLFAPKPQGLAAAQDWTHDFESRGLPEMKSIYRLFGASQEIEGKFFPFPHNYNQHSREMMYDFFNRHLHLGWTSPVKEQRFDPVPPKQLSVYDAQHPMPGDAMTAPRLREEMTRASDEQLKALQTARPQEYVDVLLTAMRAMVVDKMPGAGEVEIIESSGALPSPTGEMWRGVISRKGCGERVPCAASFPAQWNGQVVLWASENAVKGDAGVQKLLDRGAAVFVIDLFMSGEFAARREDLPAPSTRAVKVPYAGYDSGYNRTIAANRVHDLLTAIALVRQLDQSRRVCLLASGASGLPTLVARALAGADVDAAAIDLHGFDFDQIHSDQDEAFLPAALKYGGGGAFVQACVSGRTLICDPPSTINTSRVAPCVIVKPRGADRDELINWLLDSQ
jgi:hypothetical protein